MNWKVGITTDPKSEEDAKRKSHENIRHWYLLGPFTDKTSAMEWESRQEHFGCVRAKTMFGAEQNNSRWYGYKFLHDC